jgi:hypothetical protein
MAWIRLSTLNRWHGIISKGTANTDASHAYAIEIDETNHVRCVLGNGTTSTVAHGSTTLSAATWYHIACVWDGTTLRHYLNGGENGTAQQTLTPAANTVPLSLGQFNSGVDWMAGQIDDVRLYNTALTPAQILADRDTPVSAGSPPGQVQGVQVIATPVN